MSARQARFEVVHGDGGWFARFIAANGREVWRTSETYKRRHGAINAVDLICGSEVRSTPWNEHDEVFWVGDDRPTDVRVLDERGAVS